MTVIDAVGTLKWIYMWTVEANFERLWLNLGLIFNTSEVCYRLPAYKNFITTILKQTPR